MKTAATSKALVFVLLATAASAEVVLAPLQTQAERGPNLVANPGFEELDAGAPVAWNSSLSPDFAAECPALAKSGYAIQAGMGKP